MIQIQQVNGVYVAVLSGVLNDAEGRELVAQVTQAVPQGGKLVVEGTGITGVDSLGVVRLRTVQSWTGRGRLPITGLSPAIWNIIASNQADTILEQYPDLAEALSLFESGSPQDTTTQDFPTVAPGGSRSGSSSRADDPWRRPAKPASVHPGSRAGSASQAGRRSTPGTAKRNGSPSSKKWLIIGGCVLVVAVAVLAWWLSGPRLPELKVSATETSAEEGGKEVDPITVEVRHGILDNDISQQLPGLSLVPFDEESDPVSYTLQGVVANGARTETVTLIGKSRDGSKTSAPVQFTVKVIEKPLSWQLDALDTLELRAGEPITARSKFLAGAKFAPVPTGLPEGVVVEAVPGTTRDWCLAGKPAAAGSFIVRFVVSSAGSQTSKECKLEVRPALVAANVVKPAPVDPANPPAPVPAPAPAPAPSPTGVDDKMRAFFLERIERLPSSYSETQRENLRKAVQHLTNPRVIYTLKFEREGQKEVSPQEEARLRAAMQTKENKALLDAKNCQIVVVGFASKSGSVASNLRLSRARALAVDKLVEKVVGRYADLCGDYGPSDAIDASKEELNRAVEIYAGTIDIPEESKEDARKFKANFNSHQGPR